MSPVPAPRVSVVFATHNRSQRLCDLLNGLREQSLPAQKFEVVVVDDNSTDDTPQVLEAARRRNDLNLTALRFATNRGPAAARNAGWRQATAPLVAFTDDDCVPAPRWLEAGIAAENANPGSLVQGRTDPRPDELHQLGPFSRTLRVHGRGPYYQTCNVFYPRELLERIGGFDEDGFTVPGGEDAHLAWRAMDAGASAVFAPDAQVFHGVSVLGPIGRLRVAWRWTETMQIFRHPELRRSALRFGIFWKGTHYLLLRTLLGLLIRRRHPRLGDWLAWPYLGHLLVRSGYEGGGGPLLAPYWALYDSVEFLAALRGAIRYRVLVL